jgi:DNA-binding NarL/FixJ family response regulator
MNESRRIRILVVDDHPFLREGIVGAINSQSDMVLMGEASNGEEAVAKFRFQLVVPMTDQIL